MDLGDVSFHNKLSVWNIGRNEHLYDIEKYWFYSDYKRKGCTNVLP